MSYKKLANLFSHINNCLHVNKKFFVIDNNKYLLKILKILKSIDYIKKFFVKLNKILILLNTNINKSRKLSLVSKSSRKIYYNLKDIDKNFNKKYFISTSFGIISIQKAKKIRVGGELIFKINV